MKFRKKIQFVYDFGFRSSHSIQPSSVGTDSGSHCPWLLPCAGLPTKALSFFFITSLLASPPRQSHFGLWFSDTTVSSFGLGFSFAFFRRKKKISFRAGWMNFSVASAAAATEWLTRWRALIAANWITGTGMAGQNPQRSKSNFSSLSLGAMNGGEHLLRWLLSLGVFRGPFQASIDIALKLAINRYCWYKNLLFLKSQPEVMADKIQVCSSTICPPFQFDKFR